MLLEPQTGAEFYPSIVGQDEDVEQQLTELGILFHGTDVEIAHDQIIEPGTKVRITACAGHGSLPPIDYRNQLTRFVGRLNFSTRSRLAVAGLDVYVDPTGDDGHEIACTAQLYGNRPIVIKNGEGIGCFYSLHGAAILTGHDLFVALTNGSVEIAGEQGRDWMYVNEAGELVEEADGSMVAAVALRIADESWQVAPATIPYVIPQTPRFREQYFRDGLLQVSNGSIDRFCIARTAASISMEDQCNGCLARTVSFHGETTRQINSLLIKGKETKGWPLLLELCRDGSSSESFAPPDDVRGGYAIMQIYRDKNSSGNN
ncbi:hypothetical protein HY468_04860 [Candidatus Roizmanbacteria bacterium]|nr:hypothetical protein [Candidatus Roizmanbacteria bacterium]